MLLRVHRSGQGEAGVVMEKLAREFVVPPEGAQGSFDEERRAGGRVTLLIRPGKLIVDGREYLCVVRDVSEGGVKVRLFQPLPEHREIAIEFDHGDRHRLQLVWQTGDQAGFFFIDEVDVDVLIAAHNGAHPRRPPRLNVAVDAMLVTSGLRTTIVLRDISQRGASIECSGWLMIDELVRIECSLLPTLHAKVRWRRPPHYGLVFEQTFRLDELAQTCARLTPREPQRD